MSDEIDDDEVDLTEAEPSEWEIIMDAKFKQLNEFGEQLPSTYKKPMMDLLHKLGEIVSDLGFLIFANERKFKSFLESQYKLSTLESLMTPPKERGPSENLDVV